MLKNNILALALVLILSACASERPTLSGVDGSADSSRICTFSRMCRFPARLILFRRDQRSRQRRKLVGSLVFTAPYNASSVFDFYVSEMPKLKWIEVATVRAKISHMTYVRGNRAIQILIEIDNSDTARVTITAIPNTSGVGKL